MNFRDEYSLYYSVNDIASVTGVPPNEIILELMGVCLDEEEANNLIDMFEQGALNWA